MKIRTGFVSNSSSSSFVFSLPTRPVSVEEMEQYFLNIPETGLTYSRKQIVEALFHHATLQEIKEFDFIDEEFQRDWSTDVQYRDYSNLALFLGDVGDCKDCRTFEEVVKKNIDYPENTYMIRCADEDGAFWGFMEHSNTWQKCVKTLSRSEH